MRQTRKSVFLGLLVLLFMPYLVGFCWSEEEKSTTTRFSLKLTGGVRYASVGDMNKHLDSFNSLPSRNGEIIKLDNWSSDFELELRVGLSSKIGLGIATSGFFNNWNQSSLFVFGGEVGDPDIVKYDTQLAFAPSIKSAMPLGLNLYYSPYSGSKLHLLVSLGTGWYAGKMTESLTTYSLQSDGGIHFGSLHWSAENPFSLGFQGCLGLEYNLTNELALVVEVQGRYARVGNLKGKTSAMTNWSLYEESGTLYYFRTRMGEVGPWYTELLVKKDPPEAGIAPFEDVREARLDLSGYALRIGLIMRLF